MKKTLLLISVVAFALASCYYNSEETVYPTFSSLKGCDTVNISYSKNIAPIINENCKSCHGGSVANNSGGGIVLDNYTDLSSYIDLVILSIKQDPTSGVSFMPKNGGKLNDCYLKQIQKWKTEGAKNN